MKTKYNVKLLNGSKQEVTYEGIETVTLPDADSSGVKKFTAGEPLDDFTVTPDFSDGDQAVEAPEGNVIRSGTIVKPEGAEAKIAKGETLMGVEGEYVTPGTSKTVELDFSDEEQAAQTVTAEGDERWNEVVIPKPENLVPENIAKGVEVAGVVGNFDAITMQAVAEGTLSGSITGGTITAVRSYAFYGTDVIAADLPNCSVVGISAFGACKALVTASFPECVKVQSYVFLGCSTLEAVTLGCTSEFYVTVYGGAFSNCVLLKSILGQYSGSTINDIMVYLTNSTTHYGSTAAGGYAFYGCSALESIHLIGKNPDYGGVNETYVPLPWYTFKNCYKLSDFRMTGMFGAGGAYSSKISTMFDIGVEAFANCSSLKSLTLNFSEIGIAIGSRAFISCINLQDLWISTPAGSVSMSSSCYLGPSAFYNTPIASSGLTGTFGSIHVPAQTYAALKAASGWKAYSARMVSY